MYMTGMLPLATPLFIHALVLRSQKQQWDACGMRPCWRLTGDFWGRWQKGCRAPMKKFILRKRKVAASTNVGGREGSEMSFRCWNGKDGLGLWPWPFIRKVEEQDELLLESRKENERELRAESELHKRGQWPLSTNVIGSELLMNNGIAELRKAAAREMSETGGESWLPS